MTGGLACYSSLIKTRFSRSTNSKLYGVHIMINPKHRKKNLAGLCTSLGQGISYDLGYQGAIYESLMINTAALAVVRSIADKHVKIGYLPCVDKIGKLKVSSSMIYSRFTPEAVPRFNDVLQYAKLAKL